MKGTTYKHTQCDMAPAAVLHIHKCLNSLELSGEKLEEKVVVLPARRGPTNSPSGHPQAWRARLAPVSLGSRHPPFLRINGSYIDKVGTGTGYGISKQSIGKHVAS